LKGNIIIFLSFRFSRAQWISQDIHRGRTTKFNNRRNDHFRGIAHFITQLFTSMATQKKVDEDDKDVESRQEQEIRNGRKFCGRSGIVDCGIHKSFT